MLGGILTLTVAPTGGFLVSRRLPWRLALVGHSGQEIMVATSRGDCQRGNGDEFDQFIGFNAQLDRSGMLMETMRQVTNDVANDLRTPLTRMPTRLRRCAAGPAR